NTACIRFAMALMGAQFVSPSTRVPTSIRKKERISETTVNQMGNPREKYWSTHSNTESPATPPITYANGKSVDPICFTEKLVKVFFTSFHFKTSAVTPPATMKPVAGHITQRSTVANVRSGTIPREASIGGAMI